MSLSCTCGEWEPEPGSWGYYAPEDLTTLDTSRRKRCKSCNVLIDIGADCVRFDRVKRPEYEIEVRIYGEGGEIPLAPWYYCGRCGEIYLNLVDIGYCPMIDDNMPELLAEYHEITGFKPPEESE